MGKSDTSLDRELPLKEHVTEHGAAELNSQSLSRSFSKVSVVVLFM